MEREVIDTDFLLGIDLGTSSVKVLLMDIEGNVLTVQQEGYDIFAPQKGYAEQDPEAWWKATVHSINKIFKEVKIDSKQIRSVGFSIASCQVV